MDSKIAHLTFVQGVISRMAANSFLVKGWTIALVAALLAIGADKFTFSYLIIVLVPVILFWWLDAFYLHQETLYRKLYEIVASKEDRDIDFDMNALGLKNQIKSFKEIAVSKSISPFYLVIIGLLFVMYVRA
ncbi:hypothetical protein P3818_09685 [Pseudomonas aeruginosa]|uniref:hypothetical protein n=1 Tax=Pseudomonas aeruginosa TaxID=287 RepID=UPI00053D07E0|nr:hypothetical protein [Pseudomonas aeruginosa]MDP5790013.1 hypothetical protein [Pseudomonas aeruginosa]MDP5973153.1 hypothetical protein [Pseudomonas aeruginosa]HBO6814366.1 hypothetical protein [Pseudomonas aeruginosa]HCL3679613.1 hypothetical protein [Pseudomonas aeruginosa]